jgi:hypothetical protein
MTVWSSFKAMASRAAMHGIHVLTAGFRVLDSSAADSGTVSQCLLRQPRTSGTPNGMVGVTLANRAGLCDGTLAGGAATCTLAPSTICSASLVNGVAHCALPAGELPAGSYQIIAVYSGDLGFAGAFSPAQTLRSRISRGPSPASMKPDSARANLSKKI